MSAIKDLKVLIADDQKVVRRILRKAMDALGAKVAGEAVNGAEAVELYKKIKPDIMLLDMNMPVMTGDEALKAIIAEYPEAFIIMITSAADAETVENCIEAGAAGYILKDTHVEEIKEMLQEIWEEFN